MCLYTTYRPQKRSVIVRYSAAFVNSRTDISMYNNALYSKPVKTIRLAFGPVVIPKSELNTLGNAIAEFARNTKRDISIEFGSMRIDTARRVLLHLLGNTNNIRNLHLRLMNTLPELSTSFGRSLCEPSLVPVLSSFLSASLTLTKLDLGVIPNMPAALSEIIVQHGTLTNVRWSTLGVGVNKNDMCADIERFISINSTHGGMITHLDIAFGNSLNEMPTGICDALSNDSTIREFHIDVGSPPHELPPTIQELPLTILESLEMIVAKSTSVESIYQSNITLGWVGDEHKLENDPVLKNALMINSMDGNLFIDERSHRRWKAKTKCWMFPSVVDSWIEDLAKTMNSSTRLNANILRFFLCQSISLFGHQDNAVVDLDVDVVERRSLHYIYTILQNYMVDPLLN